MKSLIACVALVCAGPLVAADWTPGDAAAAVCIYYQHKPGVDADAAYKKVLAAIPVGTAQGKAMTLEEAPKPPEDSLDYTGKDMGPPDIALLKAADRAYLVQFAAGADAGPKWVKSVDQFALKLAHELDGLIWDFDLRLMFPRAVWEKWVLGSWKGDLVHVKEHIRISVMDAGELQRAVTLGMGKFGLPDLVVGQAARSAMPAVGSLINVTAQSLVEGRQPAADGSLTLELDALKHDGLKSIPLKASAQKKLKVWLQPAKKEEGDPDNRTVEIVVKRPGAAQEALIAGLTELFGAEDAASPVADEEARVAAENARKQLPDLAKRFRAGLKPKERLLVKGPFATPDGAKEWMWVEVTKWDGETIEGILMNDPSAIPTLKAGAKVKVAQADVRDVKVKED